jgi:small multidrug resistance pump
MLGLALSSAAIVSEVIGTSALAPSQGFTKPVPTIIVLVSYAAAFYLLSQTLHTIPVAVAYAVWSGAGVALITLVAWALFGQRLDAFALLGIAMIVAGVLVIQILSNASAH